MGVPRVAGINSHMWSCKLGELGTQEALTAGGLSSTPSNALPIKPPTTPSTVTRLSLLLVSFHVICKRIVMVRKVLRPKKLANTASPGTLFRKPTKVGNRGRHCDPPARAKVNGFMEFISSLPCYDRVESVFDGCLFKCLDGSWYEYG